MFVPFAKFEIPVEIRNDAPANTLLPLNVYIAESSEQNQSLRVLVDRCVTDFQARGWQAQPPRYDGKEQALLWFYKPINAEFGYYYFQRLVVTPEHSYFLNAGPAFTSNSGVTLQRDLAIILNSFTPSQK